jgi:hypothetical protein
MVIAALCLAACGGGASSSAASSQSPTSTPTPAPTVGAQVSVPVDAGQSQIDAAMAQARADGPGTWVVFPAGKFTYAGTLIIPDRINLTGQGIWDQGAAGGGGGGGTWLQCPVEWGSYSAVSRVLLGFNAAGEGCTFTPCAKDDPACGPYTQAHGSTGCTFSQVRFKGGSDTGASVLDTQNWGVGWSTASDPLKKHFLVDTTFTDCEFERPQAANSVGVSGSFPGGDPGSCLNLWYDCRPGGAQITGNRWIRCHFGVKNGYHSGTDGYGVGTTILCQGAPSTHSTSDPANEGPNIDGGSTITSANWNPRFDWSQVDHCATDNTFVDCLFEYATWYPMDLCDAARSYSMWQGVKSYLAQNPGGTSTDGNAAAGWGNPPGSQWVNIPERMWLRHWDMTRCYQKGSTPIAHSVVAEITSDCTMENCYCGTGSVEGYAGKYGNVATDTFPGGHPTSPIFTTNWSGATTSYTPSPFDP